jgi:hypothetical protein
MYYGKVMNCSSEKRIFAPQHAKPLPPPLLKLLPSYDAKISTHRLRPRLPSLPLWYIEQTTLSPPLQNPDTGAREQSWNF